MVKEIVMDINESSHRVAVLEDGELIQLRIEKLEKKSIVGNIYLGKITNILPGMQVAFVDIGIEKNAFLYVDQVIKASGHRDFPIQKLVKCGQEVLVQVQKDPIGTKGPKITMYISFPGKYVVYMPFESEIGISKKITEDAERNRLKQICSSICLEQGGLILRTSAAEQSKKDLVEEIELLHQLYKTVEKKASYTKPPSILYEEIPASIKVVRDLLGRGFHKLIINDREEYNRILDFIMQVSPEWKDKVKYFDLDYNLFDHYSLEGKIQKALQKKVWLKSGGYLIIEQTEALTVIDVNTGKYTGKKDLEQTVVKTNLEAAEEIGKQLRLRDIGGIIIIDFIDMEEASSQEKVLYVFKETLKKDPTKSKVYGMTQLGLVEMTRKKERESLADLLLKPCNICHGTGRVLGKK